MNDTTSTTEEIALDFTYVEVGRSFPIAPLAVRAQLSGG
jgi:hypothetical protein